MATCHNQVSRHHPITSFVNCLASTRGAGDFLGDSLTSCETDTCLKATGELAIEFTIFTQYAPSIAPPKGGSFPHFLV
jgi:hypothetical protein